MKSRTAILTAASLLLLIPLAGVAYLGSFTRMHGDDFCIAGSLQDLGFWPSILNWYNTWAGRFMYFVSAHLVATTGPQGAAIFPALVIVAWCLAFTWLLLPLLRRASWPRPVLSALLGAALIMLMLLSTIPSIFQSIYWRDGQVNYGFPLIGLTLLGGLLLRAWLAPTWPTAVYGGLAFGAAFLCGGFAEAFDATQAAVLLVALACAILLAGKETRRRLLPVLGAALAGSLIAMVIVVTAPGNQVRRGILGEGAGLLRVLTFSARNAAVVLGKFLLWNPGWALFAILTPFVCAWWLEPAAPILSVRWTWRLLWQQAWFRGLLLVPAGAFLVAVAACAPVVLVMNAYPEDRTIVVPQTALVLGVVVTAGLLGAGLRRITWLPASQALSSRILPGAILAACLLAGSFSLWQTAAQVPELQSYVTKWDKRDSELRTARSQGLTTLTVFGLDNRAGIGDLRVEADYWINRCMADYYGFSSLVGK